MENDELTREFRAKIPLFEQLRQEALFALLGAIEQAEIKFHSIPSRVKELPSFLTKVQGRETKPRETENTDWDPFEEIHDIVGLRVVCLYLSDLNRIAEVIRNTFEVVSEDNKIEGAEVSSFGYMSVHFVAKMKSEYTGPRYDKISALLFEIQVRTIAMDAWANVSHHLDYKSDKDVPAELRKDFYALSGLFYVADRHFEMFYSQSKQSRKEMKELFEEAVPGDKKARQELNLDTLSAYLATKFPERKHASSADVSALLRSILASGYTTIGEIDQLIDKGESGFLLYEQELPPIVPQGVRQYSDVGVVRATMHILDDRFLREDWKSKFADEQQLEKSVQQAKQMYQKYRKLNQ